VRPTGSACRPRLACQLTAEHTNVDAGRVFGSAPGPTLELVRRHGVPLALKPPDPEANCIDNLPISSATSVWSTPTPTSPRAGVEAPQRRKSPGPPKTTGANFRDPPASRIMKPWPGQPQGRSHLAATRCEPPRGPRHAPVAIQPTASTQPPRRPPGPQPAACAPVLMQRSPYGRSCHRCVTIIQSGHRTTPIPKVAATRRSPARSRKGIPAQRRLREPRRSRGDLTPHSPTGQPEKHDERHVANRTGVRAKMRVVVIRKHSRREMKKASRAGLSQSRADRI
jgi:hypothetical protein